MDTEIEAPDAALMTQAAWARHQGFGPDVVHDLVDRGLIELHDGMINPVEADAALAAVRQPSRMQTRKGKPAKESIVGLSQELLRTRVKTEKGRATLMGLKAAERKLQLVSADAVRAEAFRLGRTVRDAMLNIPDRMSALLAAETDQVKIHALLSEEIRKALEGLNGSQDEAA